MGRVIGIDTGKSGAIALLEFDDDTFGTTEVILKPFDINDYRDIIQYCRTRKGYVAYVEKVHAMPGQGVVSMFNFGHNLGFIEGMLYYALVHTVLVTPQTWKKDMGVTSDKQTSINLCKELFPNVNLKRTKRSRKDNDGMAEALLIAEYGRRQIEKRGFNNAENRT